jgi:DNA repair protein RadC
MNEQTHLPGFAIPEQAPVRRRAKVPEAWQFRPLMVREGTAQGELQRCHTPEDIARLCADMAQFAQEAFVVLDLNCRNRVIDKRLVSLGLVNASLVHAREIYRGAIANSAAAIVLAHNHPTGDASPSAEDIRITRSLIDAGRIIDIHVLDHVIIGRAAEAGQRAFFSMRESGTLEFAV